MHKSGRSRRTDEHELQPLDALEAAGDERVADGRADDAVRAAHRHPEERGEQQEHRAPEQRRRVAGREHVLLVVVDGDVHDLLADRVRHLRACERNTTHPSK